MIVIGYGTVVIDETERGEILDLRLRRGKIQIVARFRGPLLARESSVGVQMVIFGEDGSVIAKARVSTKEDRPAVGADETYTLTQSLDITEVTTKAGAW